ncbi:hypothetical protein JWZ98_21965 [Methylomonas sp. EFPC1]|uniref:Secreted protein n=1 Tax=Methylomonas defluvii TaxID=3045149 RepID=A0ABU4UJW2_9GAMM|nr:MULTISPECIES: hypothetical protein [unclassified Methylomonas]MDX8129678.1 hypothetical protein [Methylomonas sp. OY6]QSB01264.1 hypothetical protein JWZ98_21965 [Methylomonas sp. EFPC1]
MSGLLKLCVANATAYLMSVLGPTAELLSFAPPKESSQRKGGPDTARFLRSSLLAAVAERGFLPLRQRDASLHRPFGLIPPKAPVLGAVYGVTPPPNFKIFADTKAVSFLLCASMNMAAI